MLHPSEPFRRLPQRHQLSASSLRQSAFTKPPVAAPAVPLDVVPPDMRLPELPPVPADADAPAVLEVPPLLPPASVSLLTIVVAEYDEQPAIVSVIENETRLSVCRGSKFSYLSLRLATLCFGYKCGDWAGNPSKRPSQATTRGQSGLALLQLRTILPDRSILRGACPSQTQVLETITEIPTKKGRGQCRRDTSLLEGPHLTHRGQHLLSADLVEGHAGAISYLSGFYQFAMQYR